MEYFNHNMKIESGIIGGLEGQNKPQHHYNRVVNTHPQDYSVRGNPEKLDRVSVVEVTSEK